MIYVLRSFFALLALVLAPVGFAVTLDWDAVNWTPGSLTNSYDIDPTKTGNDVTITISGDTARLQPEIAAPNPQTPTTALAFQGGLATTEKTLAIAIDLSNKNQAVTVTLDFSPQYAAGIYHLSFTLFDIDYANAGGSTYQDQLSSIIGTTVAGVQVAPTITTSANNARSGTGLNQVVDGTASTADTGAGSGNGNVTIDFGHTAIRSFTFTYGSSSAFGDPTYQHVGLYDFSFSPVPEINPAFASAAFCIMATGFVLHRRKAARSDAK